MRLTATLQMLCWVSLLWPAFSYGQCLLPELALINACVEHPNPNGSGASVEAEMLVLTSGATPARVSTIGLDLPNNSFGAVNADIGVGVGGNPLGCGFKFPEVTGLPGCGAVIPLGPSDIIPANSRVVLFITGTTQTLDLSGEDFTAICPGGAPVYVLQNACARTSGAFANGPGVGDPLRTTTVFSACGPRAFTYNTQDIPQEQGAYYLVASAEAGSMNCVLPAIPDTCYQLFLDCLNTTAVSDSVVSNGAVTVSLTEGFPPYQISFTGAAAGAVEVTGGMGEVTGLGAGDYAFVATDAAGCVSDTCFASVGLLTPIVLQCSVRNNSNGAGVNGSILVDLDGGEAPFTVQIAGGPGSTTLTNQSRGEIVFGNLGVATYTVTVTDASGQVETCAQEVMQDNCPLTIVDIQLLVSDCSGADNTIIRLTLAGNDGMINTTWSGGNGIEIFNGLQEAGPLPPGEYFVSVSDQSGCPPTMAGPIQVVNAGPIQSSIDGTFVSNACTDEGELNVTVLSGGTPPFLIQLEDINGTFIAAQEGSVGSFSNLAGGDGSPNFRVYVTDALGCSSDTSLVIIRALPEPTIILEPANQVLIPPTCFTGSDGSLSLMATGGTAPYTYTWLDYPERSQGRVLSASADQTDLPAGQYVVEVMEVTGCTDTFTLTLNEGVSPTISCGGTSPVIGTTAGTVSLNLFGDNPPFQITYFSDSGGQNTLSDLPVGDTTLNLSTPGSFMVVSTDSNGCNSDTCTFVIGEIPCTLMANATISPVDCSGEGLIVVNTTGGLAPYTFAWQDPTFPPSDTVTPSFAGDYSLVITDTNGCTLDTSFTVGSLDNAPVFLSDTLAILPSCTGDSLEVPLLFSGGGPFMLTYSVSTGGMQQTTNTTATFSAVDTLTFPATWFAGGGRITASALADQVCAVPLMLETIDTLTRPDTIRRFDVTCRPEGLMIGGREFTAAMPSDTFLVDDGSECGLRYEVDITFLAPEVLDTMEVFICPGTSFEIPETGDVFNANRPEGEVAYPRPGECDSLVYLRLDIPEVVLGSFGANACAGDTIFFGDRFFTVDDPAGIARLAGQAATGCDSLVTVGVNFRRVGELRLLGDHAICAGDSLDLRFAYDGPGGINAVLEDLQGNTLQLNNIRDGDRIEITPEVSTTWSIIAAEAGGCPGTFNGRSVIEVNDISLTTEVLTNPADFCNDTLGRAIALPAGGQEPYTITWSNGPTDSLNPNLLPGTYLVDLVDAQGCIQVDSVIIEERQGITARLTALPPLCEGGSGRLEIDTIFGGAGFYEMSLNGGFFLPIGRVGDFRPQIGTGTATFQDADDCRVTVEYVVPDALRPIFNPLTDTTIFIGDSVLLDPQVIFPFDTAFWTPPATLRSPNSLQTIAAPQQTTEYTLEVVSEGGCAFIYRIRVRVDERLPVYAPNVFSPNGDNVNDIYRLEYGDRVEALLSFQVFNRWGTLMYEGFDGWDGTLDGRPAQSAVYIYQATVRLVDGTERYMKGDFVLRR